MKIVIDADCIVAGSIAAKGAAARLLDLWRTGQFEVIACPHLVGEVREALLRPRIRDRYGVSPNEVDELCRRIQEEAIWLSDPRNPPRTVPMDAEDDYLVALALVGKADALVTRDRHFDAVTVPGLRILFPGAFQSELEGSEGVEP